MPGSMRRSRHRSPTLRAFVILGAIVALGAVVFAAYRVLVRPTVADHVTRAHAYLDKSQVPEAVLELRQALQIEPRRGDLRIELGDLYMRQRDVRNALSEYVRAADVLPDDINAQIKAGTLLSLATRFDDAKV